MGAKKIQLTGKLDQNSLKNTFTENDYSVDEIPLVLDFANVNAVERSFYAEMAKLKKMEKEKKINYSSMNISKPLQTELTVNGVDELFNLEEAPVKKTGKMRKAITAEALKVIAPFLEGTLSTFKVQVDLELKRSQMYQKTKENTLKFDVISLISINGKNFQGNIALCFTNDVLLKIYNKMTFDDAKVVSDEVAEGAGELLNIIFGVAKKDLNDNKGYQIEKAIPTVMQGEAILIKQKEDPIMVLPFECEFGKFFIEIEIFINPKKES